MKRITILITLVLINLSVFSQTTDDKKKKKFIETSEVKNQYNSGACWCFSTTSFLETEINRLFKTDIELSPMFFVYHNCILQAENYLNNNGNARFSPGGLAFHALIVYDKYGCIPADIFEDNFKYENYDQKIYPLVKQVLDSSLISNTERDVVITRIKKILDENIATIPEKFEYNNELFTPKDFAEKIGVINTKDYYRITSYKDFGFSKYFSLPVAANWKNETYYNIPIEEFIKTIDYSLKNGFTLLWDGDITEYPIISEYGVDFNPT